MFPGVQGGPHENLIAAKAVALKEASWKEFQIYADTVIKNAQYFSESLLKKGARIISNGTDNHLFLLDVFESFWIGWEKAEKILESIGLSVNKNMVPFDTRKPLDPSGIRIGTPAITTRGMGFSEIEIISEAIVRALRESENTSLHQDLKVSLQEMTASFPIYP